MSRKQDETDRKIMALLAENGRQSVKELARRIGLSRSATQERLARLERDGMIAGYTIRRNDQGASSISAYMFVKTRQAICDDLAPHLRQIPEIVVFDSVAGETDAMLEVVADSMARLQEIRAEIAALEDVVQIETSVILKRHFNRR
jgi:DNA-binding Lrp family transcriptional regulator